MPLPGRVKANYRGPGIAKNWYITAKHYSVTAAAPRSAGAVCTVHWVQCARQQRPTGRAAIMMHVLLAPVGLRPAVTYSTLPPAAR